ncbi:ABC transporter ATP-binding protein [Rhodococcus artemisiae]|uniref:ABC transporter ATP-binding protein n=1 Tax=Rhodococcus artemisiae TaxID=714159 RepID=A0ABU7LDH8_9NOCA|nr:ABC transporter ATP-binding protein [Rhodococcus artemisiae]MEE2059616.1 ABC transporter ATP-binding protein [Rhodococcus artemisiae]
MLRFENITVRAGGRVLVDDVSFDVAPGEVVALVGPNGSGKSTLLRTAYRALRPASGSVHLGGRDVWRSPVRFVGRTTGVVAQTTPSDFPLTVADVVLLGRAAHKGMFDADNETDAMLVIAALDAVDMSDHADRDFARLSGGERQRVLVAQALAGEPSVLLFDEPTNHLDLRHRLALMRVIRDRAQTALVALHDLDLAARFCDRIAVMSAGRLWGIGTPEEIVTPALLSEIYGVDAEILRHPRDDSPMVVPL